jgi:hypothetical protein
MCALDGLRGRFDAVVLLGTGLPTLRAILATPSIGAAPVVSCTLALAWRCLHLLQGTAPSGASLLEWISGDAWRHRYRERTLAVHDGALRARS